MSAVVSLDFFVLSDLETHRAVRHILYKIHVFRDIITVFVVFVLRKRVIHLVKVRAFRKGFVYRVDESLFCGKLLCGKFALLSQSVVGVFLNPVLVRCVHIFIIDIDMAHSDVVFVEIILPVLVGYANDSVCAVERVIQSGHLFVAKIYFFEHIYIDAVCTERRIELVSASVGIFVNKIVDIAVYRVLHRAGERQAVIVKHLLAHECHLNIVYDRAVKNILHRLPVVSHHRGKILRRILEVGVGLGVFSFVCRKVVAELVFVYRMTAVGHDALGRTRNKSAGSKECRGGSGYYSILHLSLTNSIFILYYNSRK